MALTLRLLTREVVVIYYFYISLVYGSYGPLECSTKTITSHETAPSYKPYTSTWCPDCEVVTTTYETIYSEFCPTGVTPHTYTITEACGGKAGSPCRTGLPSGFTTTSTVCNVCGPTPITTTLTVPCTNTPEVTPPAVKPTPEAPKPYAPQPEAPKPEAPKPYAPEPVAPTPEAPKPVAPTPEAPKPYAPQPEAPKPVAPTPEAPEPYPTKGSGGSTGGGYGSVPSGSPSGGYGSAPTPSPSKGNGAGGVPSQPSGTYDVGPAKSDNPTSPNEPEQYMGRASRNLGYGTEILAVVLPGLAALFWYVR